MQQLDDFMSIGSVHYGNAPQKLSKSNVTIELLRFESIFEILNLECRFGDSGGGMSYQFLMNDLLPQLNKYCDAVIGVSFM